MLTFRRGAKLHSIFGAMALQSASPFTAPTAGAADASATSTAAAAARTAAELQGLATGECQLFTAIALGEEPYGSQVLAPAAEGDGFH